jgi:hypothetical protein
MSTPPSPRRSHGSHVTPRRAARSSVSLLVALLLVVAVLPAGAAPLERVRLHETFDGVFDDCGFPVHFEFEQSINIVFNQRGRDQLAYWTATFRGTNRWTNAEVEDGPVFSEDFVGSDRDHRVTDNGDGTLTILVKFTGRSFYALDGRRLFVDAGKGTFEVLIDHGGTPSDPSDDEFLEFLGGTEPVGRSDTSGRDFCADLNEFLDPAG